MKLTAVEIHKYKSYGQPQNFPIDPDITILVGKNESGKTAALEAIAKTNYFQEKDEDFKFNTTHDYPRKEKKRYEKLDKIDKAVTCTYELSDDEFSDIADDLGKDTVSSKQFSVTTNYDNSRTISHPDVNIKKFLDHIANKHNLEKEAKDKLTALNTSDDIESLLKEESANSSSNENLINAINNVKKYLNNKNNWDNWLAEYLWRTHLSPNMPKFMYFDEYYELPSRINLANMNTLSEPEKKTANALLELADVDKDELINNQSYEDFKSELEATSSAITQTIFEYWRNNSGIRVEFDIEPKITHSEAYLNIRVFNNKHHISLPLSNRSKGFNWFFSFIVWFSKIQEDKDSNYILLLDEPGLNLHAAAQADLLRFLEDLSENYQIIYTTHSPFMVPHNSLNRVRTVYEAEETTTIKDAIEEKDSDTLFPLQAALGYDIAQNLFINKNNLLVEGVSDLIYLTMMSNILEKNGKTKLSDEITIVPVGGLDKVTSFISLLKGQKLNIVCVLDTFKDQKGRTRLNDLISQKIIKEKSVLFFNQFARFEDKEQDADLEDLFSVGEYLGFFNQEFSEYKDIESESISDSAIIPQINKILNLKRYNHYRPAKFANGNNLTADDFSIETIDRFDKLFKEINSKF